jgi:hypothetical protein
MDTVQNCDKLNIGLRNIRSHDVDLIQNKQTPWPLVRKRTDYINWSTAAAGEIVPTFAGRGCWVVSAAIPFGLQS